MLGWVAVEGQPGGKDMHAKEEGWARMTDRDSQRFPKVVVFPARTVHPSKVRPREVCVKSHLV